MAKFSTHLLDKVIASSRQRREQERLEKLSAVFAALEKLAAETPFQEAYIFGSLTKPYQFSSNSDIDIGFIGLREEDFLPAMAFLSMELGVEVDIVQLEGHRLREKVITEGVGWKKQD